MFYLVFTNKHDLIEEKYTEYLILVKWMLLKLFFENIGVYNIEFRKRNEYFSF